MIRVNLLPEEYRKIESTSLSLFLLFLVGVVVVSLSFVAWLALSLKGRSIATDLAERESLLENLKVKAAVRHRLIAELEQYGKRLATIMAIRAGRIYWSKKLDHVVKDTPRHIWFVRVHMRQNEPVRVTRKERLSEGKDGGFLELQCFQKTDDYKKLAAYREKLMQDRVLYADFKGMKAPEFTIAVWPGAMEDDQVTLSFKVVLYLRPQAIYMEE